MANLVDDLDNSAVGDLPTVNENKEPGAGLPDSRVLMNALAQGVSSNTQLLQQIANTQMQLSNRNTRTGPGSDKLKLDSFDPLVHVAEEWCADYVEHTRRWTSEDQREYFPRYLTDVPRGTFRTWIAKTEAAGNAVPELKTCLEWLVKHYAPRDPLGFYTSKLDNVKLLSGETVMSLWYRMSRFVRALRLASNRLKVADPCTDYSIQQWFLKALPPDFEKEMRLKLVKSGSAVTRIDDLIDIAVGLQHVPSEVANGRRDLRMPLAPAVQRLRYTAPPTQETETKTTEQTRTWTRDGVARAEEVEKMVNDRVKELLKDYGVSPGKPSKRRSEYVTPTKKQSSSQKRKSLSSKARRRLSIPDGSSSSESSEAEMSELGDYNENLTRQNDKKYVRIATPEATPRTKARETAERKAKLDKLSAVDRRQQQRDARAQRYANRSAASFLDLAKEVSSAALQVLSAAPVHRGRLGSSGRSGAYDRGGYFPGICFNCNQRGHRSRDCPQAAECRYCHKTGHTLENCPIRPARPSRYSDKRVRLSCFRCGSTDHLVAQCPHPLSSGAGSSGSTNKAGRFSNPPASASAANALSQLANAASHLAGHVNGQKN